MFFLDGIKYKIEIKSAFQNLVTEIASLIVPISPESCKQYHHFMHIKDKK